MIRDVVDECSALSPAELPPIEFMYKIGSDSAEHFIAMMTKMFAELADRFRLDTKAAVLDIGCGCGRLAIPFSRYLAQGRYFGVDVWDEGVAWCANHIARANKNFSFHCLDSDNNYYFEEYRPDIRNAYSLPFVEDSSIDLVFAISVLTHLVADDCESYLSEIARALKSNGAAYLSIFIIDQYFFDYVKKTGLYTGVRKVKKGVYQAYKGQDFFAGYTEDKWRSLLRKHGLKAVSHEVGSWAEKPGARNYQDTFVVVRK